jgi:subtilisin family serine protease
MNPSEVRFSPRYPAAFADDKKYRIDTMIAVGAVNKYQIAASYSNYPGQSGIATYGGDLPEPRLWLPGALAHAKTHVDAASVDAIRGIYTADEYPALSANDDYTRRRNGDQMGNAPQGMPMDYPMYPAHNTRAWAYWSGTSYAAPIISALAARVVECDQVSGKKSDIRQVIRGTAREYRDLWTRVVEYTDASEPKKMNGSPEIIEPEDLDGKVILAVQEWCPGLRNK